MLGSESPPTPEGNDDTGRVRIDSRVIRRRYYCLGITTLAGVIFTVVFFTGAAKIEQLVNWIDNHKSNPAIGIVLFILIVLSYLPVLTGTVTFILFAAYVYGWYSFPLVYVAGMCGGVLSFGLGRLLKKKELLSIETILQCLPSWKPVVDAVNAVLKEKGIKSMILLQLSYLPFGISSVVLALSDADFKSYFIACFVSRLRLVAWVSLGVTIQEIVEIFRVSNATESFDQNMIILPLISFFFSLVSCIYVGYHAKKKFEAAELRLAREKEENDKEERRKRKISAGKSYSAVLVPDDTPLTEVKEKKKKKKKRPENASDPLSPEKKARTETHESDEPGYDSVFPDKLSDHAESDFVLVTSIRAGTETSSEPAVIARASP